MTRNPIPIARAERMTEFFAPLVPGQLGCVFDHSALDLVIGHIDVTQNPDRGHRIPVRTGGGSRWPTPAPPSAAATTSPPAARSRRSS
jgi:hypothetical protein